MARQPSLPRWACVAFCARAAERVQPIVDQIWLGQSDHDNSIISNTIVAARKAAADGNVSEQFSKHEFANTCLAGRFHLHLEGIEIFDNSPDDPDLCRLLVNAITIASKAHECATDGNPDQAHLWANDAYQFALDVASRNPSLVRQIEDDYVALHQIAAAENWNHNT